MHNSSTIFASPVDAPGGFSAHLKPLQPRSLWSPVGLHPAVWQALLTVLLCSGLLLAFHAVVQGAVLNGELRRLAAAAYALEFSRCNTMSVADASTSCLLQLNSAAKPATTGHDTTGLFAQGN